MYEDDELLMERTDYTGNELRTDGYYYCRYQYAHENIQEDKVCCMFIYKNGVCSWGGVSNYSELDRIEEDYKNGSFYERCKNDKQRWHVFQVYGSTIELEGWYYLGGTHLVTHTYVGKILNDTTIEITKENGNDFKHPDVYHFKQFCPKPDSTNNFIK